MAKITTDFTGSEDAGTRMARLSQIHDYYYGPGGFVAASNLGGVRSNFNALAASDISNGEAFGSWLAKANYLNDPDNARTELDAMVATKTAAFWDFSTATTVFEDDALTNPAEAGDVIKGFTARSVGGLPSAGWFEFGSTVATWQTTYADFDGVNDYLQGTADNRAMFQNAAAGVMGVSFQLDTLAASMVPIAFSEGVSQTTTRFGITVEADGSFRINVSRADGGGVQTKVSSAGLITTGTPHTIIATVDWANGGAGALKAYLDGGSDIFNHTLTGSGNTSNTVSLRSRLGNNVNSAQYMDGRMYRAFAGRFIPTTAELALVTGVLRSGL